MDVFSEDFAEKGVSLAYCKRSSTSGSNRWIEFTDVEQALDYVPQYDLANRSGQTIKTCYTTLQFPKGVAVEEFKKYGSKKREKLKNDIPPYVEKMMRDHSLMEEYQGLVHDLAEAGVGRKFKDWNLKKLKEVSHA